MAGSMGVRMAWEIWAVVYLFVSLPRGVIFFNQQPQAGDLRKNQRFLTAAEAAP